MKKCVSMLLIVILVVSMFCMPAFADEPYPVTIAPTENGSVEIERYYLYVYVKPIPDEGYTLDKITAHYDDTQENITIANNCVYGGFDGRSVTINVTFKPKEKKELKIVLPHVEVDYTGDNILYDINKAIITCDGVPVEGYHDKLTLVYYDDLATKPDEGFSGDTLEAKPWTWLLKAFFAGDDTYYPA